MAFRDSYRNMLSIVESLDEKKLNAPFPWSERDVAAWQYTAGNTYEHYDEHAEIIQHWLSKGERETRGE